MIRRSWIPLTIVIALAFVTAIAGFALRHRTSQIEGMDSVTGIEYAFSFPHRFEAGKRPVLAIHLLGNPDHDVAIRSVRLYHRAEGESRFARTALLQNEGSDWWTGSLPPGRIGESIDVYATVEDERGRSFHLPKWAPDREAPLQARFQGKIPCWVRIGHILLSLAVPVLLLHGLYFALLLLIGVFPEKGMDRKVLRRAYQIGLAGLVAWVAGVVVLGWLAMRSGMNQGFHPWPFGSSKNLGMGLEISVMWALMLAWRWDLIPAKGDPRPASDRVFAIFYIAVSAITVVALLAPWGAAPLAAR